MNSFLILYEEEYFWIPLSEKRGFQIQKVSPENVEIQKYTKDYNCVIRIRKNCFLNIENCISFLNKKCNYRDENFEIFHLNETETISEHPDIHSCNYLGFIFPDGFDKAPIRVKKTNQQGENLEDGKTNLQKLGNIHLESLIGCSNMTEKMMEVYYNWRGIQPYIQYPQDITINSNWTLCTGFYDLPSMNDASSSLRSLEYYYSNCLSTLSLNTNMVIFCEQKTYSVIYEIRKRYNLLCKTRFYINDFENFPMNIYREKIVKNRQNFPCSDSRNTVSYYLFCMARYAMLKIAINVNTFNSTHFSWINFCISRMDLRGVELLDSGLKLNRDKFSTAYIGYISKSDVEKEDFMKQGRCSMCSGFFTGNKEYMYEVCDLMEKEFIHYVGIGLGHADETLMSPIFFRNPELFDQYFSNYQGMLVNYSKCYQKPIDCLKYVIPGSYHDQMYDLCSKACEMCFQGFEDGYYSLSVNELIGMLKIWHSSCYYQNNIDGCKKVMNLFAKIIGNKSCYSEVKTNLLSILQVTDYDRLKNPKYKHKKLVIIDTWKEENKFIWDESLDTDKNFYIFYGSFPITERVLCRYNPCFRPMFVKY